MADSPLTPGLADRLGRLFGAEQERALGRRAVELGRVTEAQFEDAWRERERTGRPLADVLAARGWLSVADLAGLGDAMDRED